MSMIEAPGSADSTDPAVSELVNYAHTMVVGLLPTDLKNEVSINYEAPKPGSGGRTVFFHVRSDNRRVIGRLKGKNCETVFALERLVNSAAKARSLSAKVEVYDAG